jgi:exopolyphosphatase/pppGpp-phosphohydrolase
MKPDRADVIGHACRIFTTIMQVAGIKKLKVPQIGLADGIIQLLAEKHGYQPKGPPVKLKNAGKASTSSRRNLL